MTDGTKRFFASDNCATVHPEIMDALAGANTGHVVSYGDDPETERARALFRAIFGADSEALFVYNGTAANVLAISSCLRPYQAVLCSTDAHIHADECGAPERIAGCKLLPVRTENGRIVIDALEEMIVDPAFIHYVQPGMVSVTQSTELGTVYRPGDLLRIGQFCKRHGMLFHMDGARIAGAAAFLGCSLAEITRDIGLDLLSFGGTKNGMMFGEALVFMNRELVDRTGARYLRKQEMQLASKMRYISAQFTALLSNELYRRNAEHANLHARLLAERLESLPGFSVTYPVESNAVFVTVPPGMIDPLREHSFFYLWDEDRSLVRLMTSFDSTEDDILDFVQEASRLNTARQY